MPDQNNRVLRRPSQPRQPDDLLSTCPALPDRFRCFEQRKELVLLSCFGERLPDTVSYWDYRLVLDRGFQDRPRRQKHDSSDFTSPPVYQVVNEHAELRIIRHLLRRARFLFDAFSYCSGFFLFFCFFIAVCPREDFQARLRSWISRESGPVIANIGEDEIAR